MNELERKCVCVASKIKVSERISTNKNMKKTIAKPIILIKNIPLATSGKLRMTIIKYKPGRNTKGRKPRANNQLHIQTLKTISSFLVSCKDIASQTLRFK
jgi:hypothetical protein